MAGEPKALSRRQFWVDPATQKEVPPPQQGVSIGPLSLGGSNQNAILIEEIIYENGQRWGRQSGDGGKTWSEPEYVETDPQLATQFRSDQKQDDTNAPILRDTNAGIKRYNTETGELELVPGGEKPGLTVDEQWGQNLKNLKAQQELANYENPEQASQRRIAEAIASRAPQQGPAFSGTQPGMEYQSALTQANQAQASDLRVKEYTAKAEQDWQDKVRDYDWKVQTGQITSEQAKNELAKELVRFKNELDRQNELDKWNRDRPGREAVEARAQSAETRAQAGEQRAERSAQLQGLSARAGILEKQGESGQRMLETIAGAGVAPSMASIQMAYAPRVALHNILSKMAAAGEIGPTGAENTVPPAAGETRAAALPPVAGRGQQGWQLAPR